MTIALLLLAILVIELWSVRRSAKRKLRAYGVTPEHERVARTVVPEEHLGEELDDD